MRKFFVIPFILLLVIITVQSVYAISKEDLINLSRSGASDEVIIVYVKEHCCHNLLQSDIDELMKSGVSKSVVNFIKKRQHEDHSFCDYLNTYEKLQEETKLWLDKSRVRTNRG